MNENSQISNNFDSKNNIINSIPIDSKYKQNSIINSNYKKYKENENEESLKINEIDDKDKEIMKLKNNNMLLNLENERLKSRVKLLNSMNNDNEKSIEEIKKINESNIINFSNKKNKLKNELAICKNEKNVLKNENEYLKSKVKMLLIALKEKDSNIKKLREHNIKISREFEDTLESYKIKNKFNEENPNYLLNLTQEKKTKNYDSKKDLFYDELKYVNKTTIENVNSSSDSDYAAEKINKTVVNNHNKISNKFGSSIPKNINSNKESKNSKIETKKNNVIKSDNFSVDFNDEDDEKKHSSDSSDNV